MELLSTIYNRENVTELNIATDTESIIELNTANNTKNSTELKTVQNMMLLNVTSIEHENDTHHILLKQYITRQDLYKIWKKHTTFVTQAIIQNIIIAVILLIVIIVGVNHKYVKTNLLYPPFRAIYKYYRQICLRQHLYIMTPNDIEVGSIWDARQAYNQMLARRRKRQALRTILYYTVTQESEDEENTFNRNRQRQTV
ncbi:uncharacterized protein LOC114928720 isoform X2 [Nylanderia fulva]|nr:uncharacterized protein LOC114928720 isoform X2 [Nylanderia fulva]